MLYLDRELVVYCALCYVCDRRVSVRIDPHDITCAKCRCAKTIAFSDCYRVAIVTIFYGVFVLRMGVAVIGPLAVKRLYLQFFRALRHFKLADRLGQRIVALGCCAFPRQRVCVVALPDFRLAAGYLECRGLLLAVCRCHESADAAFCRQSCAVIFFLSTLCNDSQRRRFDRQFTNGVFSLCVVTLIRYYPGERVGYVALRYMCDLRFRIDRYGHYVSGAQCRCAGRHVFRDRYVIVIVSISDCVFVLRMGVAVVCPLAVCGLHFQLFRALRHFKFADLIC